MGLFKRCNNAVTALETPIGYIPYEINTEELGISKVDLQELLRVDSSLLEKEILSIKDFFNNFKIPNEILNEVKILKEKL